MKGSLRATGTEEADALVNSDAAALLLAMLLDQQIPIGWAFMGPVRLQERIGPFDAGMLAAMDPDDLVAAFVTKPALHRYPAVMARRTQELAQHIVDHHNGDTEKIWRRSRSAEKLFERISSLPGFGEEKSRIFMAVLAKRFGVAPSGWEVFAGAFADDQPRSVADMTGPDGIDRVKAWKKAQKAAGLTKQD